jgi:uncharacterized protein
MHRLKTHWTEEDISYDGSQLRAHWLLDRFSLEGDAMVAFRGPCDVVADEVADLADLDGPGIAGSDMLHFIWESFTQIDLCVAIHRQRLLSAQAREVIQKHNPAAQVHRDGDDLYVGDKKLSISIATVSPVSSLMHFAINVSPGGAPVPTATLSELGVEPALFASDLLNVVAAEQDSIAIARSKVRAKGEWR